MRATLVLVFCAVMTVALPVWGEEHRSERVSFKPGTSGTTVSGEIKGYDSVSYLLGASQGQVLNVDMEISNTSAYFNIYAPGQAADGEAMYVGSTSGNSFESVLPTDGDYTVEVYMMRNAARRDETATYDISFRITTPQ